MGCRNCDRVFHPPCVGFTTDQVITMDETGEKWHCADCIHIIKNKMTDIPVVKLIPLSESILNKHVNETVNEIICLCLKEQGSGKVIGCDFCDEWFHPDCVDLSPEQIDFYEKFQDELWTCPLCEKEANLTAGTTTFSAEVNVSEKLKLVEKDISSFIEKSPEKINNKKKVEICDAKIPEKDVVDSSLFATTPLKGGKSWRRTCAFPNISKFKMIRQSEIHEDDEDEIEKSILMSTELSETKKILSLCHQDEIIDF